MPSDDHAIQRWTALIRMLLGLKAPTRRAQGSGQSAIIRRHIRDAVAAFLEEGEESEGSVDEE